jgi:hypothetical protein
MALVRICVTEDRRGAFELAQAISARYQLINWFRGILIYGVVSLTPPR